MKIFIANHNFTFFEVGLVTLSNIMCHFIECHRSLLSFPADLLPPIVFDVAGSGAASVQEAQLGQAPKVDLGLHWNVRTCDVFHALCSCVCCVVFILLCVLW